MAGHSKWAQIKHKKTVSDAKKGRLFSKLAKEIMVATRIGGSSPETNVRLRSAIERARSLGMPKENIERAIERKEKAAEAGLLEEFLYEAMYGLVQILIEGITDNKNRTLNEVRQILARRGAKFVPQNSLLWNFEKVWTDGNKEYRPKTSLEITPEEQERILPLLDELTEHDDVQEVYTNTSL